MDITKNASDYYSHANYVWIYLDNDWKKGYILDNNVYYNDQIVNISNYETCNNDEIDCKDNLIDIPHLNEPSVLNAVNLRFNINNIYTYTGKILISVNPFKDFALYSDKNIQNYQNNNQRSSLDPHIFQISDNAYKNLIKFKYNQTILISGESGAGKTHGTKVMMKYLTTLSGTGSQIEEKVIQSNPILEAFGNAKTLRNDNSSRFGKFIKLQFNENYKLVGARIETYLLEKIRLINQADGERNFHIFYQLLSGLDENDKKRFCLDNFESYKFINYKFIERDDGVIDKNELKLTFDAFNIMGFTPKEIERVIELTSAVLNLGKISLREEHEPKYLYQDNEILFKNLEKLLKIDEQLIFNALSTRLLNVRGEIYSIKLNKSEIIEATNSFAMKLYEKLFEYLVFKINKYLDNKSDIFIGILDIFGFESFEKNQFEQLCINYTNESLQQQFNQYIFKLEQIEYEKENIDWQHIEFPDNKECLELIEGKGGLISMLDEESKLPKGGNNNYVRRIYKKHSNSEYLILNRKHRDTCFGIKHYAGKVNYHNDLFCEKNKDIISNEITECLVKIDIISQFVDQNDEKSSSRISSKTVVYQFRKQLSKLMKLIDTTSPHYVRCIKPNDQNKPEIFDRQRVNDQLKYSGILEAIRVARAGYPVRFKKDVFMDRYRMIDTCKDLKSGKFMEDIQKNEYCIGLTKVFLKNTTFDYLEDQREVQLGKKTIKIQKHYRGYIVRKWYSMIKSSILTIQTQIRGYLARKLYKNMREDKASRIIQRNIRKSIARKRYILQKWVVLRLQSLYRCRKIRKYYNYILFMVIKVQSHVRRFLKRDVLYKRLTSIIKIQRLIRKYLKQQRELSSQNRRLKEQLRLEALKREEEERKREEEERKRDEEERKHEEEEQKREEEERKRDEEERKRQQIEFEMRMNEQMLMMREEERQKRYEYEIKIKQNEDDLELFKETLNRGVNQKVEMANKMEELLLENHRIKMELNKKKNEKCIIS
jgi:myosin heavy subunit